MQAFRDNGGVYRTTFRYLATTARGVVINLINMHCSCIQLCGAQNALHATCDISAVDLYIPRKLLISLFSQKFPFLLAPIVPEHLSSTTLLRIQMPRQKAAEQSPFLQWGFFVQILCPRQYDDYPLPRMRSYQNLSFYRFMDVVTEGYANCFDVTSTPRRRKFHVNDLEGKVGPRCQLVEMARGKTVISPRITSF